MVRLAAGLALGKRTIDVCSPHTEVWPIATLNPGRGRGSIGHATYTTDRHRQRLKRRRRAKERKG